ncbi:DUF4153 domain-containing protein [Mesocricetibacter intestinalis]|uniref:DUF4153 domain-containing protein n=1 Tax=Mesocricetibacter intestinalis TaxID=1521930 RepID=UPI00105E444F|nr:DUF4153 domain-containing protein [Mesocricetibacter intestinalis]
MQQNYRPADKIKEFIYTYPIELTFIALFSFPRLLIAVENSELHTTLTAFWLLAPIYFVAIYRLRSLKRKGYFLSLLLPLAGCLILYYFSIGTEELLLSAPFYCAVLSAFIILLSSNWAYDNSLFMRRAFTILSRLILAIFAAILGALLCWIILLGIDNLLFSLPLPELSLRLCSFLAFILCPLAFLYFEYRGRERHKSHDFLSFILRYILQPGLLVYSLILYAYAALLLLEKQLPSNMLLPLTLPYLIGGIICLALDRLPPASATFLRIYRYLVFLPLALACYSLYIRIEAYGLTPDRIIICSLLGFICLHYLFNLYPPLMRYRYLSAAALILLFLLAWPFEPQKTAYLAQINRLQQSLQQLDILDGEGKIKPDSDFLTLADSAQNHSRLRSAAAAAHYLQGTAYRHKFTDADREINRRYGEEMIRRLIEQAELLAQNHYNKQLAEQARENAKTAVYHNAHADEQAIGYELKEFAYLFKNDNSRSALIEIDKVKGLYEVSYLNLSSSPAEKRIRLDMQAHLEQAFEKYAMDYRRPYPSQQLAKVDHALLRVEQENHLILLHNFPLEYIEGKGYSFKAEQIRVLLVLERTK